MYTFTYVYIYIYMYLYLIVIIYEVPSKFGYGSARGDPEVWIGLDHLRFGMDMYGSGVWIGLWVQGTDRPVHFDLHPYIYIYKGIGWHR